MTEKEIQSSHVLCEVEKLIPTLTKNGKRLAKYILQHPEQIIGMPLGKPT